MQPGASISEAVRAAASRGTPAIVGFLTAGFPDREAFSGQVMTIAAHADVVEIGVPFSDPMADGVTIQQSSRAALAQGASLAWVLESLAALAPAPRAPLVLMSYFNPLLAYGIRRLAANARASGVCGFIVPDLPWEECGEFRESLGREGLALVQMVTPVTPIARLELLARESQGFLYAVTMTGTTGGDAAIPDSALAYLDLVRSLSDVPVCAGFGVRGASQVRRLAGHVDGVIVGSALVGAIGRGEDPAALLDGLRA